MDNQRYFRRMRISTAILLIILITAILLNGFYSYKVFIYKNYDDVNASDNVTQEQISAKEAYEELQEEKSARQESGVITYSARTDDDGDEDPYFVSDEDDAKDIFQEAAASIGVSDSSNFSYSGKSGNENYDVYLFAQSCEGCPVDGGYVQIVADSSGNVVDINGYEKDVSAVDLENIISDDKALEKFEKYIKQTYQASLDDLNYSSEGVSIIKNESGEYYPAYLFTVNNADGSVPVYRYTFDAATGDFVSEEELCDYSGQMTSDA